MRDRAVKKFTLYYFLSQFMFAIALVQRIPYLSSLGYDPNERAIMLSSLALLSIVGQITFGYISDKHRKIKRYILFALTSFAVLSFFVFSVDDKIFIYHFIFVVLSGSMQTVISDLNDSWAMQSEDVVKENFSFIKGFQSFGYAFGALVGSAIISSFGYRSFASVILVLGIVIFYLASRIPDKVQSTSTTTLTVRDIMQLLKSKQYLIAIVLFISYYTITQIHAISIAEKILFLGGNERHIAYRVIIAVGLEGFGYVICNKLYSRLGPFKMLTIASIGYISMYVLFIIAKTPTQMIIFASLQIASVPFYIVSMRNLMFEISPDNLKASGQLFMTAIFTGVSGTLTPLIVGGLVTQFSYDAPLYLAVGLAIFTIVMTYVMKMTMNDKQLD